jgi:hypothetical protein
VSRAFNEMAKTRSGFWGGNQTPGGHKGEITEQGLALNSNSMTATSTFRVTESMKKARFEE